MAKRIYNNSSDSNTKKKTNAIECVQFRTNSLIPHIPKIIPNIIKKRIETKTEESISDTQFSFSQNMGTRDTIRTLKFMTERMIE